MMYVMVCQLNEKWPVGMSRQEYHPGISWQHCLDFSNLTLRRGEILAFNSWFNNKSQEPKHINSLCFARFISIPLPWFGWSLFRPRQALASQMPEPSGWGLANVPQWTLNMQMKCAIQEAWHAMFHILYEFVVSYVPVVPYGIWNSAKTLFGMASLKLMVFI